MLCAIALAEHRDEDIAEHDAFRVVALGQLGVGVLEHSLGAHVLGLLGLAGDLLDELEELVLGDGDGLGVHGLVLGLLGVGQDTDDSLADGGKGGGTPELVSAVEDAGLARLRIDQGVHLQAGVEEATGADEGVCERWVLGSLGLEVVGGGDLVAEDREGASLGVISVGTEV